MASEVDEVTELLGFSEHFVSVGNDGAGFATLGVTPGFWNPMSNSAYLPRAGGSEYSNAWDLAAASRQEARHLWIDSWNDAKNGSGIFAADPLSYATDDTGPCGVFVNTQQDSWGPESTLYVDETRARASAWSSAEEFDAMPVASDIPFEMRPGERRYVTVAMRNTGDTLWTFDHHKLGLTFSAAGRDFHLDALGGFQSDEVVVRMGGVAQGMTGVFTVLLTAPCTPGTHLIALEIYASVGGGFGSQLQQEITVAP
jgi:hypothetical protein